MVDERPDPVYKYIDDKINELKQEYLHPLSDRLDSLTGALLTVRAFLVSQSVLTQAERYGVPVDSNVLVSQLQSALSTLYGRLAEQALPEDAYAKWKTDVRKRLSNIFTPQQVDALVPASSSWEEIIRISNLGEERG